MNNFYNNLFSLIIFSSYLTLWTNLNKCIILESHVTMTFVSFAFNWCLYMQLYAMPVFDMIETVMVKKLHFEPSWLLRFVVRNVYVGEQNHTLVSSNFFLLHDLLNAFWNPLLFVSHCCNNFDSAFTMFVGITFPFFGALLGFFGGFAFAPTTYFVSPSKSSF